MTNTLIKNADVQGLRVTGVSDARLRTARALHRSRVRQVRFLIVEGQSLSGGSDKFHPVPWSALRFDAVVPTFQLAVTKDDFKSAPSYDREQLANASYGWDEQAAQFFSTRTAT